MTLTLELPPATERALGQAARRRGVALEEFALDVLAREAQADALDARYKAFFEVLEETEKAWESSTVPPMDADYVSRIIHECREERTVEILAAGGIIVEPEPYDAGDSP